MRFKRNSFSTPDTNAHRRLRDIEPGRQCHHGKSQFPDRPVAQKTSRFDLDGLLSCLKYFIRSDGKNLSKSACQ